MLRAVQWTDVTRARPYTLTASIRTKTEPYSNPTGYSQFSHKIKSMSSGPPIPGGPTGGPTTAAWTDDGDPISKIRSDWHWTSPVDTIVMQRGITVTPISAPQREEIGGADATIAQSTLGD
ncbi:hypothetical protein IAT40_005898 [Kwoniella sp. CBS 6097]